MLLAEFILWSQRQSESFDYNFGNLNFILKL